jgi:hypothetical protein
MIHLELEGPQWFHIGKCKRYLIGHLFACGCNPNDFAAITTGDADVTLAFRHGKGDRNSPYSGVFFISNQGRPANVKCHTHSWDVVFPSSFINTNKPENFHDISSEKP